MTLNTVVENFAWHKFGTAYHSSAKEVGIKFLAVLNGTANDDDYHYIINHLEHQATLYKISPWGLKFCFELLNEKNANKVAVLYCIQTLFEASNYNSQVDKICAFKATKKDLQKYEILKTKLFDDEFDGYLNDEFLKLLKLIKRNFWHIAILDYIHCKKSMIEILQFDKNQEVANKAKQLLCDINNPKQYEFS